MLKNTHFKLYVCIGSKKTGAFETYGESLSHVKKYGGISKKYQNLTVEEALEISKNEEKIINKRQKISINNNNFSSKSECEKYTKKILEKYKKTDDNGEDIDLDINDHKFMMELFNIHYSPDTNENKYEPNDIKKITVKRNNGWGNNNYCFFIHLYSKNTPMTFSYKKCFTKPKSKDQLINQAFRYEISKQITEFKEKKLEKEYCCPDSSDILNFRTSEVDHVSPLTFEKIVSDFFNKMNIKNEDLIFYSNEYKRYRIKENIISERWKKFHLENSKLELISKESHINRTKNQT